MRSPMIVSFLLTFFIGFAYDYVGVFYMKSSIESKPVHAAFLSVWLGGASIMGLGAALASNSDAVALLLGYGVGTYVATKKR